MHGSVKAVCELFARALYASPTAAYVLLEQMMNAREAQRRRLEAAIAHLSPEGCEEVLAFAFALAVQGGQCARVGDDGLAFGLGEHVAQGKYRSPVVLPVALRKEIYDSDA